MLRKLLFSHFSSVSSLSVSLCPAHQTIRTLRLASALYDALQVRMPSLSPTMQMGTIVKWHKKEGESLVAGDVLCDIQTDKAVLGFEADEDGILAKILKPDNSVDVSCGSLIALIVEPGADWKNVEIPTDAGAAGKPAAATAAAASAAATSGSADHGAHDHYGPAVRSILEVYNIKPSEVKPTGPHGRLLKGDLLRLIKENNLKPVLIKASPVETTVAIPTPAPSKPTTTIAKQPPHTTTMPPVEQFVDVPLTTMRSVIAKRLTQSKIDEILNGYRQVLAIVPIKTENLQTTIPHSYATIDCCIDNLNHLRKELLAAGVKVGVNDFIIKAVAVALQKVPEVNAIWSGDAPKLLSNIDISVAVATDNGLITPIVKNATDLGVEDISVKVKDLAGRARAGKLKPEEFQGGSFTISNLGMFGISFFSAVVNPPQACILAIGGSRLVPVEDEERRSVKIQTMMSVTTSTDTRVVDDITASRFLVAFREIMENPTLMISQRRPGEVDKLFAK